MVPAEPVRCKSLTTMNFLKGSDSRIPKGVRTVGISCPLTRITPVCSTYDREFLAAPTVDDDISFR